MSGKYFVHTGEYVEYYATEQEAKASAEKSLAFWKGIAQADGEWPDECMGVCWGQVHQRATETDHGEFVNVELLDTPTEEPSE